MVSRARVLLITFLGGMVFALLLTERWRRLGESSTAVAPSAGEAEADVAAPAVGGIRGRVVAPVVAGVKHDVTWARAKAGRITHHDVVEEIPADGAPIATEPVADEARPAES